jgi:hypothetical protein
VATPVETASAAHAAKPSLYAYLPQSARSILPIAGRFGTLDPRECIGGWTAQGREVSRWIRSSQARFGARSRHGWCDSSLAT